MEVESKVDDDEIERQAIAELMQEAKRGAERAKELGAQGWMKPQIPRTNKRFLRNTLVSTLRHPYKSKKYEGSSRHPEQRDRHTKRDRVHNDSPQNRGTKWKHKRSSAEWDSSFSEEDDNTVDNDRETVGDISYIYDAYAYGFDGTDKSQNVPESSCNSCDAQKDGKDNEKSTTLDNKSNKRNNRKAISRKTESSYVVEKPKIVVDDSLKREEPAPDGGYLYDAYNYGYQGAKDPIPKDGDYYEKKNISKVKDKDRYKDKSDKSDKRKHRHHSEPLKNRHKRKLSVSSEDAESKVKQKKHKKKHKHKSSKHKKSK